jgi:hypothetical protein
MLLGCGGGSRPSGFSNRAFVSNSFAGTAAPSGLVEIVNANNDRLSGTASISAGSQPGLMAVSPQREITLVFDQGTNQVSIITNSNEKVNASAIQLPAVPGVGGLTDMTGTMIAQSASTGYATFRNLPYSVASTALGEVAVLDLTNVLIANTISVPQAHRMVMNHAATRLLVFSDRYIPPASSTSPTCTTGSTGTSAVTVIDISGGTATNSVLATVCGFNEAVWGVFSSDDSTAYIMNCGPECSSSLPGSASVAVLNMASNTVTNTVNLLTISNLIPNSTETAGATVGLLSGTTLYVAGMSSGGTQGTLTTIDVSQSPPAVSGPAPISDGYHNLMALGSNNKLFIGSSTNCTNSGTSGCLTIFDTSAPNTLPVIDQPKGFVTGMAPIANRNVVYVVEGGQLKIYDTTTSVESTTATIDIVGTAVDVRTVDQ